MKGRPDDRLVCECFLPKWMHPVPLVREDGIAVFQRLVVVSSMVSVPGWLSVCSDAPIFPVAGKLPTGA
jgi:hypothetical protein